MKTLYLILISLVSVVLLVVPVTIFSRFPQQTTKQMSNPDGLDADRLEAITAKQNKGLHAARFKKYSDFCGGDENVSTGSWSSSDYGVFGCKDYSKVPDENLPRPCGASEWKPGEICLLQ